MVYPSNEPDDVPDDAATTAAEELREFVEAFEDIETKKRDLAGDQKEVMASLRSRGYDTKVFKRLIALRKRDPNDVAEEESILEVYKAALGME